MEKVGLKPTPPCLQSRCSNQLSYNPMNELRSGKGGIRTPESKRYLIYSQAPLTTWIPAQIFLFRGPTPNRTRDTRIFSPLLYQLSYESKVTEHSPCLSQYPQAKATECGRSVRRPVRARVVRTSCRPYPSSSHVERPLLRNHSMRMPPHGAKRTSLFRERRERVPG